MSDSSESNRIEPSVLNKAARWQSAACILWLSACYVLFGAISALAQEHPRPRLYTNEQFIDDVTGQTSLDVEDTKAVLEFVLGQLPARVRVYPTENYYYYYFYQGGVKFSGNFRFDVGERDKGLVEFIYFKDTNEWIEDETDHHATLGEKDGVKVEKVADFEYSVSYAGKSVAFVLNDLSDVRPPEGSLGEDETFLGPVADESGIRFYLVFDEGLKLFRYILDETVPVADELADAGDLHHLRVGRRTGFVFLQDPNRDRKLLVGVYAPNVDVNNYLDGPFDQLPDNFQKADELRRAILLARPDQKESIDRLGIQPGGEFRVSIDPYVQYIEFKELAPVDACGTKQGPAVYQCLDPAFSDGG